MAKNQSVQQKLSRARAPRVKLTYDLEKGDGTEQKEIPFVLGVVSDLSGTPQQPLPRLKDRKFVSIDADNFDDVLKGMSPRAVYRVPNVLSESGGEFAVEISFKEMADFRPEAVVHQVEPLRKLLEARTKLADLRNKLAGNDKLEDLLQEVLTSTDKIAALGSDDSPR